MYPLMGCLFNWPRVETIDVSFNFPSFHQQTTLKNYKDIDKKKLLSSVMPIWHRDESNFISHGDETIYVYDFRSVYARVGKYKSILKSEYYKYLYFVNQSFLVIPSKQNHKTK